MEQHNYRDENHKDETFIQHTLHLEKKFKDLVLEKQRTTIEKFPFIFLGLSTFGGVAVFYGFEKIIDQTPYLADKPLLILVAGFFILILTGALYRKLS